MVFIGFQCRTKKATGSMVVLRKMTQFAHVAVCTRCQTTFD